MAIMLIGVGVSSEKLGTFVSKDKRLVGLWERGLLASVCDFVGERERM